MQIARLVVAVGKMIPVLRVSVAYTGAVPSLHSFGCVREDIAPGDITVTAVSTGTATLTWASGKFPVSNSKPIASANDAAGYASATAIANGVTVNRRDVAGASVDMPWTVEIF